MGNKPEGAYTPSDDELDDLVNTASGEDGTDDEVELPESPAAPSTDAAAPARASTETDQTPGAPGTTTEGDDEDDDEPETGRAAPAAEPAPDAQPAPPPGSKPFQFKASGQERVLPGALELADGSVAIPKTEVGRFRSTLASAVEIQGQFTRYQRETRRQLEGLQAERNEKDVAADAIAAQFAELETMDEDQLWEWVQKFRADIPKLKQDIREAQLTHREKMIEAKAKPPEPTPEERTEQRQQALTNELAATYRRVADVAEVKQYLTKEELDKIFQKHSRRLERLVTTADADDPDNGIKKGQTLFDDTEVLEDIDIAISLKKKAGAGGAAARNAALNADVRNNIPPAPRRATTGAAAGGKGDKPWSKKAFLAGELDDEE